MITTAMVHVRVDETTKTQASEALASMGLSVSDAVRALLFRIATEKELPFALKVPNAETAAAMKEARAMVRGKPRFDTPQALFNALAEESK